MKKPITVALGALMLATPALAQDNVVNVYNWSDYIAEDTIAKFEAETGIKVNYDVFDSNELVEAKLLAGNSGYDVVVPSGFFLERQVAAGLFLPLDKSKLPNLANMDPDVMAQTAAHDPDNAHSVDYMWGTTAIGYNVGKLKERLGDVPVDTWDIVFKPENSSPSSPIAASTLLDAPAEVMATALNYLGLDPNSESAEDLSQGRGPADVDPAACPLLQLEPVHRRPRQWRNLPVDRLFGRRVHRPGRGGRSRPGRRGRLRHPQGRRAEVVRPVRHSRRCPASRTTPTSSSTSCCAPTSPRPTPTTCSTPRATRRRSS